MLVNKGGMKPFVKRDEQTHAQTDGHQAFYILPSRAYRPAGDNKIDCSLLQAYPCSPLTLLNF